MSELNTVTDPNTEFEELGARISGGEEQGLVAFNEFLLLGIDHWRELAERGGDFAQKYADLAKRYEQAAQGGYIDKLHFCKEEAQYLNSLAREIQSAGDSDGAKDLRNRANNWRQLTNTFTLTG